MYIELKHAYHVARNVGVHLNVSSTTGFDAEAFEGDVLFEEFSSSACSWLLLGSPWLGLCVGLLRCFCG